MFSALISGIVAATTTTALSAFSEGIITAAVIFSAARGQAKASISIKK